MREISIRLMALGLLALPIDSNAELFISEYIEGSSNNKALEIYNGSGAAVDLAAGSYNVQLFFNGSSSGGSPINLVGTVAMGDVFVLANSSADDALRLLADQTSGSLSFNGDDAIVLRKGTDVLDVIGQIGFDPGTEWGSGVMSTADNTLRRKGFVVSGDTNGSDAFDPQLQWDGYAANTFDGLGAHIVDPPVGAAPEPNTVALIAIALAGFGARRFRRFDSGMQS